MSPLEEVQAVVADHMAKITKLFKPGVKITVLVRTPDFPTRDFMMTDDTAAEIVSMIERRKTAGHDTP